MTDLLRTCSYCGTDVLPMNDGRCPHCRRITFREDGPQSSGAEETGQAEVTEPGESIVDSTVTMTELEQESGTRVVPVRRGGGLIGGGVVLMIGAVVGMLIGHNVIGAQARSGSYGSGSMGSLYMEAGRLNDLAAKEGTLDIIMGLVILSGLVLLVTGVVRRVRSVPRVS